MTSQTPEKIPNIEERCEHGVVAKYCFRCKRPDLAGPIPNIEEEKSDCELYEHIPEPYDVAFWHCKVCGKELYFDTIESLETHHHQLQKARQDWLQEEIVRLEGMKTADYPSSLADPVGFTKCLSKNNTLQTIIDRYQAELDQEVSK